MDRQLELFVELARGTGPKDEVARVLQGYTVRGREASEDGVPCFDVTSKLQSFIHSAGAKHGRRNQWPTQG